MFIRLLILFFVFSRNLNKICKNIYYCVSHNLSHLCPKHPKFSKLYKFVEVERDK
jgi:hypothetical protein